MLLSFLRQFAGVAALVTIGSQACGATMTFDKALSPEDYFATYSYVENGIKMVADRPLDPTFLGGVLHMDDGGTSASRHVTFTMGKRFRAVSFQVPWSSFNSFICNDETGECEQFTSNNLLIEGFRGGKSVISQWINTDDVAPNSFQFSRAFTGLTSIRLWLLGPQLLNRPGYTSFCADNPCSHFNLDNVTLSPVPVPAGLPLVGSAIAMLGFLGVRARKRRG